MNTIKPLILAGLFSVFGLPQAQAGEDTLNINDALMELNQKNFATQLKGESEQLLTHMTRRYLAEVGPPAPEAQPLHSEDDDVEAVAVTGPVVVVIASSR